MLTTTSVPAGEVTRTRFFPSSLAMAFFALPMVASMSATEIGQRPKPSSIEPMRARLATDSLTAGTCAKRFAHSRLVMMMIWSEVTMAWCRLRGGTMGNSVSARARRIWASLLATIGRPPRSATTVATISASGLRRSSVMIVTTSPSFTSKQVSTTSSAEARSCASVRSSVIGLVLSPAERGSLRRRSAPPGRTGQGRRSGR